MPPTKEEVVRVASEKKLEYIRLQLTDILGTPKNIVIPTRRLEEVRLPQINLGASLSVARLNDND